MKCELKNLIITMSIVILMSMLNSFQIQCMYLMR